MKGVVILLMLFLFFPLISAEIIINPQLKDVYSLGDIISVPVTIKSSKDISGIFQMDLLCNGQQTNFYKNGVSLSPGEEKSIDSSLILTQSVIGELKGKCKIKAFLGEDFTLSGEFRISDLIKINITLESLEFVPGENILIEGEAVKENNEDVDGFIELSILEGNISRVSLLETINNGFFSINFFLPNDMKAGAYLMKLKAYEKNIGGEITNKGFVDQNIRINQVPTSLEIVFENTVVEPGTNLIVKIVLHDQTGEKIQSFSFITIKNQKDKILEQTEIATDEFFEFPVAYNEPPSVWKIVAVSNKLTSEASLNIAEKEDIEIEIINKTIIITNTGNVIYNKTVLVKIEDESLNIDVYLGVDKSQKYILTAPDGEYSVEVIADGESTIAKVALTGKSIDVKKASGKVGSLVRYPVVWIFIIFVLGFITLIIFKRGYQKNFVGYITSKVSKKRKDGEKSVHESQHAKNSLIGSGNKAELSLSMRGDKQNVSVVTLNVKKLGETKSKEGNADETLQKIVNMAEKYKAATYENHNTIFFILAPTKTKTFKNERTALDIAQKIKEILLHHNKMFKQKINFGISLNYGTIIAKQEAGILKFMSMGTLMTAAKRISSLADDDILLGEKINDRLRSDVKTTKHEKNNVLVYSIKEIKKTEDHTKFVRDFLNRIESDKRKKQ